MDVTGMEFTVEEEQYPFKVRLLEDYGGYKKGTMFHYAQMKCGGWYRVLPEYMNFKKAHTFPTTVIELLGMW